jgi:hypothetical protein
LTHSQGIQQVKTARVTNRLRVLLCASAVWAWPLLAAAQFPAPPDPAPAPRPKAAATPAVAPKPVERPKPRPARPGEAMTDPIKCWWKTTTTEVRIGERFTVILTCGVIETPSLKVIPNTNALDPGALQVTPFEVASGVRHDDILSPPWRYLQYEYQVRLLSEGFFGKDVTLPAVRVTYNVQAGAGGGSEGRDLTYQLPPLPMRIASLVPAGATDIRDVSSENFALIETRRFRATTEKVGGFILVGFAAVFFIVAVAAALGRVTRRQPATNKRVAPSTVRAASVRALATVRTAVLRDGWSPALVRRAQSIVRVAAALALGTAFAQTPVDAQAIEREGQLAVLDGWTRRRRVLISAAPTPATIERALAARALPARRRAWLDTLRHALQVFNAASYGKPGELDTSALDRALADSSDVIKQMRIATIRSPGRGRLDAGVAGLGAPSITGDRA